MLVNSIHITMRAALSVPKWKFEELNMIDVLVNDFAEGAGYDKHEYCVTVILPTMEDAIAFCQLFDLPILGNVKSW